MGIREKLHLFKNKDNAVENSSKEAARKCVLKVQDKFRLRNTDDIVVVGELKSFSIACFVSFSERLACSVGIFQSIPRVSSRIEIPPSASG